ncbi:MAG: type II secretion system GspH family protein [Gallionella sp.]|nr:type II secretion system GspH family protein [Gallionella sp.]
MHILHIRQSGFTLVEMIMVIVITGIIGGMVAVFLKAPIQQYMDVSRRAELTDIADLAIRRMARDVRTAVPNSVRVANCGASPCVEYLPTKDGGRYRAEPPGNVLDFGVADGVFDIVGTAINFVAGATRDYIVVGSTQSDGNPPYDTTPAGILRAYTGVAGLQTTVNFTNTALPIWAELSSQRFDVVDGAQRAVTYACENLGVNANGNGTGQLMRYWNYGFNVAQVNPPGGQSAILAGKLSDCTIAYDLPNQRFGLLTVRLTLTSGGESVSLYNEIHVNNAP